MSSVAQPNEQDDELEAAVDQAIAVCGGDMRAAVRALIVANNFLESEIAELIRPYRTLTRAGAFGPTRDRFRDLLR